MSNALVRELITAAKAELSSSSESPKLDAELLLAHVLKCTRLQLLVTSHVEINATVREEFNQLVERRKNYEPIAYLTGVKEFWGLEFSVNSSVLIPRPDTETLVEQALQEISKLTTAVRILDLGTGSGAIAISLAAELYKQKMAFEMYATDQSPLALEVAQANSKKILAAQTEPIKFIEGSWFEPLRLDASLLNSFDLIVSNPPYIDPADTGVCEETRRFEPASALYAGGVAALADIEAIILGAADFLKVGGTLLIEIGSTQAAPLLELLAKNSSYSNLQIIKDLAQLDRVVKLTRVV